MKKSVRILQRLVELKLMIEQLKPAYGEFDQLLEWLIGQGITATEVEYEGAIYALLLKDLFEKKNTAWKSVAQRRFDLEITREAHAVRGPFRVRRRK